MKSVAVIDGISGDKICFLDNAFSVGYTKVLNSLWTARFTLPYSDPKNQYCIYPNAVDIWDGDAHIGVFRISPISMTRTGGEDVYTYDCEHVLGKLLDTVMPGWVEAGGYGVDTETVISDILALQPGGEFAPMRWHYLGGNFSHAYQYGWENENLLSALLSVPKPFAEEYIWAWDTSGYGNDLFLFELSGEVKAEIRYEKNMSGVTKTVDYSQICTRLYAYGYGEGVNTLGISAYTEGGVPYLDSPNTDRYGVVSRVWKDERYQVDESLFEAAKEILKKYENPIVTYSFSSAQIGALKEVDVGDAVRVVDGEDGIDIITRVIEISKTDVIGAPDEMTVTLGNISDGADSSAAALAEKQKIEELYSQGATSLFADSMADNADPEHPARMRFYIPENAVHVNSVILSANAAPFRAYSRSTYGGGARSVTTQEGGGGSYTTTQSTAYTVRTSGSGSIAGATGRTGGGSATASTKAAETVTTSSSSGGNATTSTYSHGETQTGSAVLYAAWGSYATGTSGVTDNHSHAVGYPQHTHYIVSGTFSHSHTVAVASHTHTVTVGAHSHTYSLLEHDHSVTVGSHEHDVTISAHTHTIALTQHSHTFSLPDHTHDIQYGIYTSTTASTLTLYVDGRSLGEFGQSIDSVDIVEYMDSAGGKVSRGWHTCEIKPDTLSRVEANISVQLFANARSGGQY